MMQESIFILYVRNQQVSRDFYARTFAKEPCLDVPGMTEFEIVKGSKLGLMENDRIANITSPVLPHPATADGIPRCEMYLYVDQPLNYLERALNAGAKIVSEFSERNWGDRAVYIADPDGHVIVFAEKI